MAQPELVFQAWSEAHLSDDELKHFAETLTGGVRHVPKGVIEDVRMWLRSVLSFVGLPVSILRMVHPSRSRSESVQYEIQQLRTLINEGHAIIARIAGAAAAFCSARFFGTTPEGRTRYALTSVTLPAYQHRGLNNMLREKVAEHIEAIDEHAFFVIGSKNPIIIARCRKEGWVEIPYDQLHRDEARPLSPQEASIAAADGYQAFFYDPIVLGSLAEKIRKIG